MAEILTAVQKAIKEYGVENISMVGYNYHGRYEDDDCNFIYYNNITGNFFYDEWTTRFACPAYSCYECQTLEEADKKGYVDHEKLFSFKKFEMIKQLEKFKFNNIWGETFAKIAPFGLRVEVNRGRKWKGIGYLVGTFTTSYQWGVKMWRSNNDYGTSTTRHAKIYDPTTNRIETVTAEYVKFLDLDNIIEQYKKDMIAIVEATTIDDFTIGKNGTSYSPYSGDSNDTKMNINCEMVSFMKYLESKGNKLNLNNAFDVIEEAAKKKYNDLREKKLPGIITWVRNNTDKTEEGEILELAEHIFKKHYGDK